jgi:hypothetical protein
MKLLKIFRIKIAWIKLNNQYNRMKSLIRLSKMQIFKISWKTANKNIIKTMII